MVLKALISCCIVLLRVCYRVLQGVFNKGFIQLSFRIGIRIRIRISSS